MTSRGAGRGRRQGIVVLGMHRSGTSALAAVLHHCGAILPRYVMEPGPDNPTGFFESNTLVELADAVLASHGLAWDTPGQVPPDWFDSDAARGWAIRYADALAAEFPDGDAGGERPLLVKDPRLCRLVPLVAAAFRLAGVTPRFAVSLRHPEEVARSLQVRDACSVERGLVLWLEHYLAGEQATRGAHRTFVSYDAVVRDWRAVAARVGAALGLSLRTNPPGAAELDEIVSPALRHHTAAGAGGPAVEAFQPWLGRCHDALLRLEAGDHGAATTLDGIRRRVARLERALLPVALDVDARIEAHRDELKAVQSHLAHAEKVIGDLETRVAGRDDALLHLRKVVADRDAALADRDAAVAHGEEAIRHLRGVVSDLEARVADRDAVERHLRHAEGAIAELEARVADREAVESHLRYAERRISELEAALAALWRSRSMRLTRPLRWLGRNGLVAYGAARRGIAGAARAVFRALPLPVRVRERIRTDVARRRDRRARAADTAIVDAARRTEHGLEPVQAPEGEDPKETSRREVERNLIAFLDSDEVLELPAPADRPAVSVILVLYNQAGLTFACLRALAASLFRDFEVVIVDNASTDRTAELLRRVRPCRVLRNDENLHFLRACNQAASHAAGRYLLFLNNDTRPSQTAIGRALRVFSAEDRVGAVGGRLILPDGRLQEAGSIVWSDGSCLGYGRGGDPVDPRFLFRRDVDYCSAAFLMTPRALFDRLGRFDEAFAPAYYEETDYCMRLWDAGYRVVYEPGVTVVHFEFGSSDTERGTAGSRRNQSRFLEKHGQRLQKHLLPAAANVLAARSARRDAARILCIDDRFPHRRLGSGFPRANDIVRELVRRGCEVTLYATDQPAEPRAETYADLPERVECLRGDREGGLRSILEERRDHADVILVSRPHNMEALGRLLAATPDLLGRQRVVYDAEALFTLREIGRRRIRGTRPDRPARRELIAAEVALARPAHAVIAVSEYEAAFFRDGPGDAFVVGHSVDPEPGEAGFEDRAGFLFVGAFHGDDSPNADSVVWFVREVWPRIREDRRTAGATLRIVGRDPSPAVRALDRSAGVEVVGGVDRTRPFYDEARVFIVPTRFAAGLPYKAHEAAAHGVPLVTTRLIARQLGWRHGRDLLAASAAVPDAFARCCVRLHTEPELWDQLRRNMLGRLETDCSAERHSTELFRALGLGSPGDRSDAKRAAAAAIAVS